MCQAVTVTLDIGKKKFQTDKFHDEQKKWKLPQTCGGGDKKKTSVEKGVYTIDLVACIENEIATILCKYFYDLESSLQWNASI